MDSSHLQVVSSDGKFTTESSDVWDLDRHYCEAGRDKVTVNAPLTASSFARIQQLMNRGLYLNHQAFIRDAVAHRLHYIAATTKDENLQKWAEDDLRRAELEDLEKTIERNQTNFANYAVRMQEFVDQEDWFTLTKYLNILSVELEVDKYKAPWDKELNDIVIHYQDEVPENWRRYLR